MRTQHERQSLLAKTIVLEGESHDRFLEHLESFNRQFDPQDEIETALVEHMAISRWRQLSVWGLETAGISHAIREHSQTNPESGGTAPATRAFLAIGDLGAKTNNLNLLHRYDTRFDRQYYRAYTKLMAKKK